MKKTKFAYLFATALVAGTMGLTSCQEEVEKPVDVKTSDVTIGLTLKGATTRSTGAEVNLEGSNIAKITKPMIVPMVDGAYLNPIILNDIAAGPATAAKAYKQVRLQQNINAFRVYGNVNYTGSEANVFVMPSLTPADASEKLAGCYEPYGLYYYAEAVASENPADNRFLVGTSQTPGDWETAAVTPATASLGNNNRVRINGVKYAVGVLTVGVRVDLTVDEAIFGGEKYAAVTPITLSAITVSGQPADLDATFAEIEGTDLTVYEEAADSELGKTIEYKSGKVEEANVYCVVAPESDESVTVNFEFINTTGKKFTNNAGVEINPNDKFYLATVIRKDVDNNVFEAAKTTLLNVAVKDWGKATTSPVQTTDAEIGVVVDTSWAEGMVFDQEI